MIGRGWLELAQTACFRNELSVYEQSMYGNTPVQLVVSELFTYMGITAYHTSVIIRGVEYSFQQSGICRNTAKKLTHQRFTHDSSTIRFIDLGFTNMSATTMVAALHHLFSPGTYDLLRKNCNSFTDCALAYLVRLRLHKRYRAVEAVLVSNSSIVKIAMQGRYVPNETASSFDLENVANHIMETGTVPAGDTRSMSRVQRTMSQRRRSRHAR